MSNYTNEKPSLEKKYTRRQVLKQFGIWTGLFLAGSSLPLRALAGERSLEIENPPQTIWYAPRPVPHQKFAMVIDVKACIGCRRCVYACVRENNIGRDSGIAWIKVLEMEPGSIDFEHANLYYTEGGRPDKWYLPVQCMQCDNPPCVQSCPVTATWKESDGIVVQDYKRCIGCRYCMMVCPYFARHFNWKKPVVPKKEINPAVPVRPRGVVEKCLFCIHRTRRGKVTACVEACPVQARKFGDINNPQSVVAKIVKTRRTYRIKEELGTEPSIYYVW